MSQTQFNKIQKVMAKKQKFEVAAYIGRAIDNFVKDYKSLVKISYHFE